MTKPTRSSSGRAPRSVADWWEAADLAEESGDYSRAIVCYRRALEIAPFNRDLRRAFCEVLNAQYIAENGGDKRSLLANLFKASPARNVDAEEDDFDAPEDGAWEDRPSFGEVLADLMPNSRTVFVGASAMLAVSLTVVGIFAAGALSSAVGGIFNSDKLPSLVQPSLPAELESVLAEANTLAFDEQAEEAVEKLRDAKIAFPEHEKEINAALVTALRSYGSEQSRERRYIAAADAFREASQLAPERAINWIDLGRALRDEARIGSASNDMTRQRQVLDDAEAAFQQALKLAPNDPVAMFGLAKVYDARNNRSQAAETYETILQRAPDSTEAGMARVALAQLRGR